MAETTTRPGNTLVLSDEQQDARDTTVHKAAGSEWSNVLLLDTFERWAYLDPEHRRWLYTAITRAADQITVMF